MARICVRQQATSTPRTTRITESMSPQFRIPIIWWGAYPCHALRLNVSTGASTLSKFLKIVSLIAISGLTLSACVFFYNDGPQNGAYGGGNRQNTPDLSGYDSDNDTGGGSVSPGL